MNDCYSVEWYLVHDTLNHIIYTYFYNMLYRGITLVCFIYLYIKCNSPGVCGPKAAILKSLSCFVIVIIIIIMYILSVLITASGL